MTQILLKEGSAAAPRLRLGVSRCLLGEPVRYDGSHKLDRFVRDELGKYVDFVPVCPEVESGLGVPRPPMRLVGDPEDPRLVEIASGADHTRRLLDFARIRCQELAREDLCGFIFKAKSPSSGMERVKVYAGEGRVVHAGTGLFARVFMARFPLLPCEDEGRLHDPGLRENFIERVFTLHRFRQACAGGKTLAGLIAFHASHKLLLMSHGPAHVTALGRLVATGARIAAGELFGRYEALLIQALRAKATVKKQVNTLMHAMGYFKKVLNPDEKAELLETIAHYAAGDVPLIVPVTLINHYARKFGQGYLLSQAYLRPHPIELKLRNHV